MKQQNKPQHQPEQPQRQQEWQQKGAPGHQKPMKPGQDKPQQHQKW